LVLIALAAGLAACGGPDPSDYGSTSAAVENKLTQTNYARLVTGMSYAEAAEILGGPGEEVSSNEIAGTRTVLYSWKGERGANMNAMFQNDKLVSKAQFGLP
jgi:hypothetical protein